MTTYEWTRGLPSGVAKWEHYRSLEQLILSITKDIDTDLTCTCCGSMVPILFFFENITKNKGFMPTTGRYLFGTKNNISFYVDPGAEYQTITIEASGEVIAKVKDTWQL